MSDAPNLKLLKKIAAACRKAGIASFEGFGFKITLEPISMNTVSQPIVSLPDSTAPANAALNPKELSPEELMFWSSDGLVSEDDENQQDR